MDWKIEATPRESGFFSGIITAVVVKVEGMMEG